MAGSIGFIAYTFFFLKKYIAKEILLWQRNLKTEIGLDQKLGKH